jgi:hypothetical protein
MGDPNPEIQAARIKEEIFAGNKIQAIKLHRELTGMGLKESKDAVEAMEAELRRTSPTLFSQTPGKATGCLSLIALVVTVAIWRMLA